jgi:hypothetical protein
MKIWPPIDFRVARFPESRKPSYRVWELDFFCKLLRYLAMLQYLLTLVVTIFDSLAHHMTRGVSDVMR